MQIARQKFEKTVESAKQKFGTEIKTDFPGDLPESLQNAYDYYEKDNAYKKKLNKKLKDTSVREVCNGVSAEVTKAFFQIQMGKARNINTGHDLSERNVELVVDLLAAAQICEEIQNNQKVDKEKQ